MRSIRFNEKERSQYRNSSNEDSIKALYPTSEFQTQNVTVQQNLTMKDMLKQKDEGRRLTELRSQVRKTPVEYHKLQKTSGSVASYGSRNEKRKDGKGREGREQLSKTVERLRFENAQLEKKVNDLSQTIQHAEVLNQRALLRGHEKDQLILSLRKESVLANEIKLDEINRRCRLEAELKAIRVYVDYMQQKKGDRLRNKAVQTETTIPSKLNSGPHKPVNPFKKIDLAPGSSASVSKIAQIKAYSNYKALEAATTAHSTKMMEQEFQIQTKMMKHRFLTAASKEQGEVTKSLISLGFAPAATQRRFSYPADQLTTTGLDEFSHSEPPVGQFNKENTFNETRYTNIQRMSSPLSSSVAVKRTKSNPAYYQHSILP